MALQHGGREGRHDFLEKALARVPLLAEGEGVDFSSFPDMFHQCVDLTTGVIEDFGGLLDIGRWDYVESVDLSEAVKPMTSFDCLSILGLDFVGSRSCSVESACSICRNVTNDSQFNGGPLLIQGLELVR